MRIPIFNVSAWAIFITALFSPAESGMVLPQKAQSGINGNTSQVTAAEVLAVITNLNDYRNVHLQLFYDSNFAGILSTIAMKFSPMVAGIMVFQGNITTSLFSTMLQSASEPTYLFLFCSPEKVVEIFEKIRIGRLRSHLVEWLVFAEDLDSVNTVMANLNGILHEGTHVTIFMKEDTGRFCVFVSGLTETGITAFRQKGIWENIAATRKRNRLLKDLMTSNEEHLYSDMRGRELIVSAQGAWPFFELGEQLQDGSYEVGAGMEVTVLKALSSALNFTFRVLRSPNGAPGIPLPDGTVTGTVGLVARREAHMGLGMLAVNEKRATVVDYAYSHFRGLLGIVSKAPTLKNRALAVLSSFTVVVWLFIVISEFVMGVLLFTLSEMSSPTEDKNSKSRSLDVYVFNVFRSIVLQGNTVNVLQWSERILFFSWYLFCLIVTASYSGMLTAVLAIPSYERPIDYLEDLPRVVKEGYTLSVTAHSSNELLFKEATSGIYEQVWLLFNHKDRSQSFVSHPAVALARILERKYVFLGPFDMSRVIAMKMGGSKFYFGRQKFFPQDVALVLPQGAPYKKAFDQTLMRLVEGGLPMKWLEDEIRTIPQSNSGAADQVETVISLTHIQAALYVIAMGYLIGSVSLFVEVIYSLDRQKRIRLCKF